MSVDLHTHPIAHGTGSYKKEFLLGFVHKAKEKGIQHLGFTDHDRYLELIDFTVGEKLKEDNAGVQIYLGLEVDYSPEKEHEIKERLIKYPLDYVIGSVHRIGDWACDIPEQKDRYAEWDVDQLYDSYFQLLMQAASSDLFQIIGHLDLIKIFNYRPKRDIFHWVEPCLRVIQEHDLTVEVNAAGLYKPVGEIYPEERIIKRCFELNIPVTISSDAHEAKQVGRINKDLQELLKKIGYKEVAVFKGQTRRMLPL